MLSYSLDVCMQILEIRITCVQITSKAYSWLWLNIVWNIWIALHKLLILILIKDNLSILLSKSNLLCFKHSLCLLLANLWARSLIACASFSYIFHVLPFKLLFLHLNLCKLLLESLADSILVLCISFGWFVFSDRKIINSPQFWTIVSYKFDLPSWDNLLLWVCLARDCVTLRVFGPGRLLMLTALRSFRKLLLLWDMAKYFRILHFFLFNIIQIIWSGKK